MIYPGIWIDIPDRDDAFHISTLLSLIESSLIEAALALGGYIHARTIKRRRLEPDSWEHDAQHRQRIEEQVRADWGIARMDFQRMDELRLEVDRRRLTMAFEAGQLPDQYAHHLQFVYAKSFLFSLHSLHGTLRQVAKYSVVKVQAQAAVASIDASLPHLRGVRDSTAHVDERVQGKAQNRKIETKLIQNRMINAPGGGVMVIGSLNGENFGSTMEDGYYGEVPVTVEAFNTCVQIGQKLLNDVPWKGPPRIVPTV